MVKIENGEEDKKYETESDLSLNEIVKKCEEVMEKGGITFIKFTCPNCGSRQTSIEPNTLHTAGYVCDNCGELAKPNKFGMLAIFTTLPKDEVMDMLKKFIENEKEKEDEKRKERKGRNIKDIEIGYG